MMAFSISAGGFIEFITRPFRGWGWIFGVLIIAYIIWRINSGNKQGSTGGGQGINIK